MTGNFFSKKIIRIHCIKYSNNSNIVKGSNHG